MFFGKVFLILAFTTEITAALNIELLWPFDNNTYGHEVFKNSPTQNDSAGCLMMFANVFPTGFSYPTVIFDGTSFFDLPLENVLVPDDHAFAGWFYTTQANGTFFHYVPDSVNGMLKEIKIWFENQQINFLKVLQVQTEQAVVTFMLVPLNTWFFMSFGIDYSNGKVFIYIDDTKVYDVDDNYYNSVDFPLPGTLRVGGTFNDSAPPLTGFATGISFFVEPEPKLSDIQLLCTTNYNFGHFPPNCTYTTEQTTTPIAVTSTVTPAPSSAIPTVPAGLITGHNTSGVAQFIKFLGSTGSLEEFTSRNKCSVVSCAAFCARMDGCRYFQYDALTSGCLSCRLLKDGTGNTVLSNGQYFIITSWEQIF